MLNKSSLKIIDMLRFLYIQSLYFKKNLVIIAQIWYIIINYKTSFKYIKIDYNAINYQ